jgi:hypothetical protein
LRFGTIDWEFGEGSSPDTDCSTTGGSSSMLVSSTTAINDEDISPSIGKALIRAGEMVMYR